MSLFIGHKQPAALSFVTINKSWLKWKHHSTLTDLVNALLLEHAVFALKHIYMPKKKKMLEIDGPVCGSGGVWPGDMASKAR